MKSINQNPMLKYVVHKGIMPNDILHVGYTIVLTEEDHKCINAFLATQNISEDVKVSEKKCSTALMFHTTNDQKSMQDWFNIQFKKDQPAYLKGLFAAKKCVVGHCTIGPVHTWIVLSKGSNITPIHLKKQVSNGSLGNEMVIPRITLKTQPYITRK